MEKFQMSTENKVSKVTYTSRVSQLDAVILDQEFYKFIKNQLINILDKVQLANWVHVYEPEFDFILSSIVWRLTVGHQQCTIGQRLLGLKYIDSKPRQILFYIFNVVLPYLNTRLTSFFFRRNYQLAVKYSERMNTGLKILQVVNFCAFLVQNKYMTLSHRLSKLRMISSRRIPFAPGDSYQIRELLWHQFSDFLMIMVPFIKLHIVKRYWMTLKKVWNSTTSNSTGVIVANKRRRQSNCDIVAKCCHCNQDAVIPLFIDNCSFCYYCFHANQYGSENVHCPIH